MAYGNVLGYTPAPQPGAYNFQQANGKSMLLFGPQAEDLKAKLDASSGLAGQAVAGPGGGAPGQLGGGKHFDQFGNEMTAPAQAPAFVAALNHPSAPNPNALAGGDKFDQFGNKTYSAPAAAPQAAAQPAPVHAAPSGASPAAPSQHGQPAIESEEGIPSMLARPPETPQAHALESNGINSGYVIGPNGKLLAPNPVVAGVSKDQLLAKYGAGQGVGTGQGVVAPHSMSETISGGFTPDANYLERRADLAIDKRLAIDKTADIEAANAVREKQIADQQEAMAAQWKSEEQARQTQIQAGVQRDEAEKNRLQKELGDAKVNPTRIFSGPGGTWRAIGAAISVGLGAAGAGMQATGGHPGAPNIAFQAIQSAIDRDISAQENAIKIKGTLADNALAQYIRSGQSMEQAKLGLRMAQTQWVAAQTAQSAAMSKGAMVEPNRDMLHNQVLSSLNDDNEQYRQLSLAKHTQQVASQVVYAHGASGGGYHEVTPDKALDISNKVTEGAGKGIKNAQELYNLQHPKAPGAAKQQGALADIQAAKQAVLQAAADGGLSYKDGKLEGDAKGVWNTGYGGGEASKTYASKLLAAAPLVQVAMGQKRLSTAEEQAWADKGATRSGESNKIHLEAQLQALDAKERAVRAGGGGVV